MASPVAQDKGEITQIEDSLGSELAPAASEDDVLEITTKSPYGEVNFIGTYAALVLSATVAYGGWIMPATSLQYINADIGPSQNINWVALAWTLCTGIATTLVGRLSDIFGRRYFFIAASLLALVGCCVAATAKTVNQLIGANVLIGLAAAAQQSFNYVVAELVPVRHRFYGLFFMYALGLPIMAFGPIWTRLFIVHTSRGWRWDYYLMIVLNAIDALLWFLFYHPPKFNNLHRTRSKMQECRDIDFFGIFLFTAGLLLFIMGLSWGGVQYPWKSAHVISTIVIGFCTCVAFVLYELYAPLKRPIIPMHLFRNLDYSNLVVVTTVGGMMYFSISDLYPMMVSMIFTSDLVYSGILTCTVLAGTVGGQMLGTATAVVGGHIKWKLVFACTAMTAFNGGMAGVGENKHLATALSFLGALMVGALEGYAIGLVTIVIDDQREIGAAAGVFGSLRTIGAVVSTAILSSVLSNKLASHVAHDVVPAIVEAGLPDSSVQQFVTAFNSGSASAFLQVPGITNNIIAIGTAAMKQAYSKSFSVVFLASISFGACAIISACFVPNVDDKLSGEVVRRLGAHGLVAFGAKAKRAEAKESP